MRGRSSSLLLGCLLGCRAEPAVTGTAAPRSEPGPVVTAGPEPAVTPMAAGCQISLPAGPAGAAPAEGPAFVLVDGVGLLRIADGEVTVAVAMADRRAEGTVMAVGPQGELWLSDWQGVRVLGPEGALRTVRTVRDGPRYEHMVVRSATEVWAVSSDIEWEVVRYDGRGWKTERRRSQFRGRYSDNQFNDLAVTSEGVWVTSWNGLWRGVGADWRQIAVPEAAGAHGELWTYRDRVILGAIDEFFVREGEAWRPLGWPGQPTVLRAIAELGVVAGPSRDRLLLRAVEGECEVTSEAVVGGAIDVFTVDAGGRSWVSSDRGLAVIDLQGRVVAQWETGGLPGLTGAVVGLAVVGTGPGRLPAGQAGRRFEVVGRLTTYKRDLPLANVAIELCSAHGREGSCADEPGTPVRVLARTGADGSFRFAGVPEGQLYLLVRLPEDQAECETPYNVVGGMVHVARDCAAATAPGVCDLGMISQCMPFEMPPPH